jgi:K+ transport systems, NAD-binding component
MRILVVGDGKVGHMLSAHLAQEGHDVVIVDKSESVLRRSQDTLDVMTLRGNGANAQTLMEAQVDKADVLLAATASDETNMLCALIGKRLGAKYAIARIRDPEYHESLDLLQKELDIDMAVNPERATALEISRLIRFPFATSIESFSKGRVEMVGFHVHEDSPLIGFPIKVLRAKTQAEVLYAAIERDAEIIIPNGDIIIQEGDYVHVVGEIDSISEYFRQMGKAPVKIKDVTMMGGGRISYYLAKMLIPLGMNLTIIEINEAKAVALSETLPEANIICGDASDQELLQQEGIENTDAFIALSNRDEENLLTGLYAATLGIKKVVVKNNRVTDNKVIDKLDLDSIVSPKSIVCDTILRYVRAHEGGIGTAVEKLYSLLGGKAEALEFIAMMQEPYIGVPLKDLKMKKGTLVVCIVRNGKIIIPFGNDYILTGDSVIIVVNESGISDLNEVMTK